MTDDKFILMGLDDERAGNIAEALKNPTCKRILNFLGDIKEASEKDIADALKMPINTAEYNLNKLIKSGLVEKTKNFFWSVKGKKIQMYKLARKHIIISPNKNPSMNYLKTILPVILIAVIAIVLAGLFLFPKQDTTTDQNQIKQFASQEDLNNFIKQNQELNELVQYSPGLFGRISGVMKATTTMETATAEASDNAAPSAASDYSTTNIQIQGVDEADIVKNDGKYIYVVNGNKVKIINAYPAENMEILSEINISGVSNIFINDNKLIVFANNYGPILYKGVAVDSIKCEGCGGYEQNSLVYVYDISDKENPELENEISVEGNYIDSRMINNYVYVVSTKYVNTENPEPPIYYANGVETKVSATDIYYWPYPDISYVFTSIIAINVKNGEFNKEIYLTGSTNTIFVSQDNIYLTYQKAISYKDYAKDIAEQVYYPILPSEYDTKIEKILDSDKNDWEKLSDMEEIVNDYSKELKGDDFSGFSEELSDKIEEFNIEIQKQTERTVIHKINVDKDNIGYKGVGEIPGRVLNQFSMDEYEGNFRIATTTGNWQETSLNHLYVLDENLKIIGSVEDLAKGERIYSTRFIGKRAYMITFKQVDPLFVIDLSNPEKPEVLGYLKITGFSDYLHPYDEDHIIGIGKEATEQGRFLGLKISLFDVSDVQNPVEKAKIVIGDRGTDSLALQEHKAFLFDKKKNLLVIPISLYEINKEKLSDWSWGEYVWQGAYVLNINTEEISVRGKITHVEEYNPKYGPAEDEPIGATREINGQTWTKTSANKWKTEYVNYRYGHDYDWSWTDELIDQQEGGINYKQYMYDWKYQIQRSLYMDDALYTISQAKIKANNLESVDEINSVSLPYEQESYPYPLYETVTGV